MSEKCSDFCQDDLADDDIMILDTGVQVLFLFVMCLAKFATLSASLSFWMGLFSSFLFSGWSLQFNQPKLNPGLPLDGSKVF